MENTTTMKTDTDRHWNTQAKTVGDDSVVNIHDIYQRDLENEFLKSQLRPTENLLEVGCGNGFSTRIFCRHAKHVDAFDYSEDMIDRAKRTGAGKNVHFFHDNVLEPKELKENYDTVVCVRVLINLPDLTRQRKALTNLIGRVANGGRLILMEGFRDGFDRLSEERVKLGMSPLKPAAINFYSSVSDLWDLIEKNFTVNTEFHTGTYDYFTRVVYPTLVGEQNVKPNTEYAEKFAKLSDQLDPAPFKKFARLRGFVLQKK